MDATSLALKRLTDRVARSGVVCLVGAGGKTTLMYSLARVLAFRGLRVTCGTTTKIFSPTAKESPYFGVFPRMTAAPAPEPPGFVTLAKAWLPGGGAEGRGLGGASVDVFVDAVAGIPDLREQSLQEREGGGEAAGWEQGAPKQGGILSGQAASLLPNSVPCPFFSGKGKLLGYEPAEVEDYWRQGGIDLLLLEADGAARRFLKAPAAHEPVIPACTRLNIALVGLEGLGRPLDSRGVWRADTFAALSGLAIGEPVTPLAVARVVSHPQGLFKNSPSGCRRILFLNEAGSARARVLGFALAEAVLGLPGHPVDGIYIGSARRPEEATCLAIV